MPLHVHMALSRGAKFIYLPTLVEAIDVQNVVIYYKNCASRRNLLLHIGNLQEQVWREKLPNAGY
jgi:hypothetical protein